MQQLKAGLTDREQKKGRLHKVFADSFIAKPIFSQRFLLQKMNYIYKNPVSAKWMLVKDFTCYENSSASFYERQETGYFKPMHFMDLKLLLIFLRSGGLCCYSPTRRGCFAVLRVFPETG